MSWFGLGGSKKEEVPESNYDFTASGFEESVGGGGGGYDPSLGGGVGSGGNMGQLEELVMAEQQKALVQSVIARLTEMAFENCVAKPASALSSSEQGCIKATVAKYLDTSEFVLGRVQRSAQRGQSGGH
ncbi:mitochondrial protein translocase family [Nannochloropsis oceanica]